MQMAHSNLVDSCATPKYKETVPYCYGFGANVSKFLKEVLKHPNNGVFAPACYSHTTIGGVLVDNTAWVSAFGRWLLHGGKNMYMDEVALLPNGSIKFNPT